MKYYTIYLNGPRKGLHVCKTFSKTLNAYEYNTQIGGKPIDYDMCI